MHQLFSVVKSQVYLLQSVTPAIAIEKIFSTIGEHGFQIRYNRCYRRVDAQHGRISEAECEARQDLASGGAAAFVRSNWG